jgi:hypothetical protein
VNGSKDQQYPTFRLLDSLMQFQLWIPVHCKEVMCLRQNLPPISGLRGSEQSSLVDYAQTAVPLRPAIELQCGRVRYRPKGKALEFLP